MLFGGDRQCLLVAGTIQPMMNPMKTSVMLTSALALALLTGCRADPQPVGDTGLQATYILGTLRCEVSPRVDVLTALAAAETALVGRGYTITKRTQTDDRAHLRAFQAGLGAAGGVQVEIANTPRGTGIVIGVEPLGDETTSRVLLEAIAVRLSPAPREQAAAR